MKFEVRYQVYTNNINSGTSAWQSFGPSHYDIIVNASSQFIAEQMVKNMNGGSNHCHIIYARHIPD